VRSVAGGADTPVPPVCVKFVCVKPGGDISVNVRDKIPFSFWLTTGDHTELDMD